MQDPKSLHQALPGLIKSLFADFATTYPELEREFLLDFNKLQKRVKEEGLPFLTVALPSFFKSILNGLETGLYLLPLGFKRAKGTKLPLFTKGLLAKVFDVHGHLLESVDENALAFLYQLTALLYKLELPYDQKLIDKAIQNFKDVDNELGSLIIPDHEPIIEGANSILKSIFKGIEPSNIVPRHGKGSVATGEKSETKWYFKRLYKSIHSVYPYYDYFVPSRLALMDSVKWYRDLQRVDYGTSKFMLVPKDSRGPRSINMEPLEFQFIQQGLMRLVVDWVRNSPVGSLVNFKDQGVNRQLALQHSESQEYATLDLKDASDRVSTMLVKRLFCGTGLLQPLLGTRSQFSELPTGEVIQLNKFAPMGSALCFPVEALCFYSIAEALRKMWRIPGKVYVFGDDMIVPKRLVKYLFDYFPTVKLEFNKNKCFVEGKFRESCGVDAYNGIDITPVRVKKLWPRSTRDAYGITAAVDSINNLFQKGYWRAAEYLRKLFVRTYGLKLPVTPCSTSFSGLSWKSFQDGWVGRKMYNPDLQRYELRSYTLKEKERRNPLDSYQRLFANLVGQCSRKIPVPQAGHLNLRWCA